MTYALCAILGFATGVASYNTLGLLVERQTGRCAWCRRPLTSDQPTP